MLVSRASWWWLSLQMNAQVRLRVKSLWMSGFLKQISPFFENSDFWPLYTHIDAEFHGESIFGRFRIIRKRLNNLNSKKLKPRFQNFRFQKRVWEFLKVSIFDPSMPISIQNFTWGVHFWTFQDERYFNDLNCKKLNQVSRVSEFMWGDTPDPLTDRPAVGTCTLPDNNAGDSAWQLFGARGDCVCNDSLAY